MCAPTVAPRRTKPTAWRRSLRLITALLAVWFTASLGLGVLLAEPLNRIWVGGFPVGFWFAQQGSILVFLVLLLVNAVVMDRIERAPAGVERGAGERSLNENAPEQPDRGERSLDESGPDQRERGADGPGSAERDEDSP